MVKTVSNSLAAAGYDNVAVQQRVNEILQGVTSSPQDDLSSIAEAVYRGDYGNGQDMNQCSTCGWIRSRCSTARSRPNLLRSIEIQEVLL